MRLSSASKDGRSASGMARRPASTARIGDCPLMDAESVACTMATHGSFSPMIKVFHLGGHGADEPVTAQNSEKCSNQGGADAVTQDFGGAH